MSSSATITPASFELTPMRVKFNGVDVGGANGVSVNIETTLSPLMAENFGTEAMDFAFSGFKASVKMVLLETKEATKANWKIAFPHAVATTALGQTKLEFTNKLTDKVSPLAQILLLHPLNRDDADLNGDYKFLKAVCKSASEVKYGPEEQVGLEVEFMILPDTSTSPAKWLVYGDPGIV